MVAAGDDDLGWGLLAGISCTRPCTLYGREWWSSVAVTGNTKVLSAGYRTEKCSVLGGTWQWMAVERTRRLDNLTVAWGRY